MIVVGIRSGVGELVDVRTRQLMYGFDIVC